eukprot:CAMPEP_0206148328 /NCGR_PEP_ID=MMETSP1473-20131121/36293_1 /ASSEMBLY_ACC=CAM_ASM_001109 /TAXON_ID=1461547 /ORGANISM="Stichococcus sp, Strain RCC1054" /LENGTH=153 /DNA_ID=CAMNT_0053545623 /DNA_START=144 /DNA_END=605 /DNA_ORIENTATION=+
MAWRRLSSSGCYLLQRLVMPLEQQMPHSSRLATAAAAADSFFAPLGFRWMSSSAAIKREEPLYGGQTLLQIRSRVFGDHIGNGLQSGRKLLRRKLNGAKIASYYGNVGKKSLEQSDPFMEDLDAQRKKAKLERLARRGKAPPKKGQGKRGKRK